MNKRFVWIWVVALWVMVIGWSGCSGPNGGNEQSASPAAAAASANPAIAYIGNILKPGLTELRVMNGDGSNQTTITQADYSPSWSPDGKSIAFDRGNRTGNFINGDEIWRVDVAVVNGKPTGSNERLLVPYAVCNVYCNYPAWSPLGNEIAFQAWTASGLVAIMVVPATGGTPTTLITAPDAQTRYGAFAWRSDGSQLAVATKVCTPDCVNHRSTDSIQIVDRATGTVVNTLLQGQIYWNGWSISWARGRDTLAFTAELFDASGIPIYPPHIYTVDIPSGSPILVTNGGQFGAKTPSWSPDNSKLVYIYLGTYQGKTADFAGPVNTITLATGATATLAPPYTEWPDWRRF